MRKLPMCLILISITIFAFAEAPSFDNFTKVYDKNPDTIYQMVVKLYAIEHAIPVITFPTFTLLTLENKSDSYLYELVTSDPMTIAIGVEPDNLLYSIDLQPNILKGYIKNVDWSWQTKTLIAIISGSLVFVAGIFLGLQF